MKQLLLNGILEVPTSPAREVIFMTQAKKVRREGNYEWEGNEKKE